MHNCWRHLFFAVVTCVCAAADAAEITLFEFPDLGGRRITLHGSVPNFDAGGFTDRAASMVIRAGYRELCSDSSGRWVRNQYPYNARPAWDAQR